MTSSLINKTLKFSLGVIYTIFIVPNAWWAKNVSDPLALKKPDVSSESDHTLWVSRKTTDTKLDHARRQY